MEEKEHPETTSMEVVDVSEATTLVLTSDSVVVAWVVVVSLATTAAARDRQAATVEPNFMWDEEEGVTKGWRKFFVFLSIVLV